MPETASGGDWPGESSRQLAHEMWVWLEAIHAVTYFTPEARAAHEAVGLRGFWRRLLRHAGRAPGPGRPGRGRGHLRRLRARRWSPGPYPRCGRWPRPRRPWPPGWPGPPPPSRRRCRGGRPTPTWLRRPSCWLGWWTPSPRAGRPLGAANAGLAWPDDPLAALWHGATVIRELRGDGHVAVLTAEGLDGLLAHALRAAVDDSRALVQPSRGFTDDEWDRADATLAERGLLDADGRPDARRRPAGRPPGRAHRRAGRPGLGGARRRRSSTGSAASSPRWPPSSGPWPSPTPTRSARPEPARPGPCG